jgi:hypothetical protein
MTLISPDRLKTPEQLKKDCLSSDILRLVEAQNVFSQTARFLRQSKTLKHLTAAQKDKLIDNLRKHLRLSKEEDRLF